MSHGPGRPALVRRVESFEEPALVIPSEVVVDTCFVVKALIKSEPLHTACQSFLTRMASHGTVIYYSRLLELEFAEVAFKIAVIEQHGRQAWPQKRRDGRVRRRAGRLSADLLKSWNDLLVAIPHLCIELEEVIDQVPSAMKKWGLASYDAAHAATAIYVDAAIVTTDAGFGLVPESILFIYTDASRVRSCRRLRGGR